tara:strand:+ start:292 stop:615 length:324 start_codon:yes stop_codon:yes gene_type:complete
MYQYLVLFLIGGFTVSGIKYLASILPPSYAAVVGAIPMGLLTSITLKNVNIIDHYIENYAMMSFIILLSALLYNILISNNVSLYLSYGITILFWVTLVVLKLNFIKI